MDTSACMPGIVGAWPWEAGARSGSGLLGMGRVPRKGLGRGGPAGIHGRVRLPQSTEVF